MTPKPITITLQFTVTKGNEEPGRRDPVDIANALAEEVEGLVTTFWVEHPDDGDKPELDYDVKEVRVLWDDKVL
jgi:hypothetical protein